MADKATRVEKLARALCQTLGKGALETAVGYAALHCYDDLASHVVYEFPELQGYMGGQYAALTAQTGDEKTAAKAMEQCYWPLTSSSELPQSEAGNIVSLAGKLDTLAGNFLIGQIPTGSEDPFALRRQAFAVVRILLENKWTLCVRQLLDAVNAVYDGKLTPDTQAKLADFLRQRVSVVLQERGHNPALLAAVPAWDTLPLTHVENLVSALETAQTSDAFSAVRESAKRVANILKKSGPVTTAVDEKLFELPAEKALYETARALTLHPDGSVPGYQTALQKLETFKEPLSRFFTDVMVNVPDEKLRQNRLALLMRVQQQLAQTGADITAL